MAKEFSCLSSSPVAPLMAWTLDICASNSIPVLTAEAPKTASPAVTPAIAFATPAIDFAAKDPKPLSPLVKPDVSIFVSNNKRPSAIISPPFFYAEINNDVRAFCLIIYS